MCESRIIVQSTMELFTTKDQSHTLYVSELDETYHSRNGAFEEAMYVYIGKGLLDWIAKMPSATLQKDSSGSYKMAGSPASTSILEIGFGTGLNAWLTAIECAKEGIHCRYHSLETKPLEWTLLKQLNYTQQSTEQHQQLFAALHTAPWNAETAINNGFSICKFETPLQSFEPETTYDIIYFDAFAPEKQPELWTATCFQKLFDCLNPNGVIVTYSSKGDIKRLWRQIGFEVERLPGPPLKRHMLRGRKADGKAVNNT
jgi:tRNA U34 5-methylaminomethyl-2-thiouridine-forming methyltransferase MnmC